MKIIKGGVRCQYWNRAEPIVIQMADGATEEEIEEAMREAALEAASFEYWIYDGETEEQS